MLNFPSSTQIRKEGQQEALYRHVWLNLFHRHFHKRKRKLNKYSHKGEQKHYPSTPPLVSIFMIPLLPPSFTLFSCSLCLLHNHNIKWYWYCTKQHDKYDNHTLKLLLKHLGFEWSPLLPEPFFLFLLLQKLLFQPEISHKNENADIKFSICYKLNNRYEV